MDRSKLERFLEELGYDDPSVRKAAKRYLEGYLGGNRVLMNQGRDMLYRALGKSPQGLISELEERFDGSIEEEGQ